MQKPGAVTNSRNRQSQIGHIKTVPMKHTNPGWLKRVPCLLFLVNIKTKGSCREMGSREYYTISGKMFGFLRKAFFDSVAEN